MSLSRPTIACSAEEKDWRRRWACTWITDIHRDFVKCAVQLSILYNVQSLKSESQSSMGKWFCIQNRRSLSLESAIFSLCVKHPFSFNEQVWWVNMGKNFASSQRQLRCLIWCRRLCRFYNVKIRPNHSSFPPFNLNSARFSISSSSSQSLRSTVMYIHNFTWAADISRRDHRHDTTESSLSCFVSCVYVAAAADGKGRTSEMAQMRTRTTMMRTTREEKTHNIRWGCTSCNLQSSRHRLTKARLHFPSTFQFTSC